MTDTINYRIIYHMKVTAIISDEIIQNVKTLSQGKNLTESLIIALNEWIALKKIQALNKTIKRTPLRFSKDFSAQTIRKINRN